MDHTDENIQREYCKLHADTLVRVEKALDEISKQHIDYVSRIARIEVKLDNGLSKTIEKIAVQLDDFCEDTNNRLIKLEEFKWFRVWVTRLRDNIFKNILMLALGGGVIYMVIRFGDELIKKILR